MWKKPVRSRLWQAFVFGEAGGGATGSCRGSSSSAGAVAFTKAKGVPGSVAVTAAGNIQEMAFSPALNLIPNGNINLLRSDAVKAAGREEQAADGGLTD